MDKMERTEYEVDFPHHLIFQQQDNYFLNPLSKQNFEVVFPVFLLVYASSGVLLYITLYTIKGINTTLALNQ